VMRNQKGYVAGYSGQLVITDGQVIAGAMLSWHPADRTLLHSFWTPPPAADRGPHPPEAGQPAQHAAGPVMPVPV